MELQQQLANLQGEVKLLKGEIKSILKEVRVAVLNRDNPFSTDAGPPVFRPVGRAADELGGHDAEPEGQPTAEAPAQPTHDEPAPAVAAPVPAGAPAPADVQAAVAGGPATGPAAPMGPAAPEMVAAQAPALLHPAERQPLPEGRSPKWDLLTIASLAAWTEDALVTLGQRRMELVLQLACFADLLSPDMRDALGGLIEAAPEQKTEERPMNINECLVVLRQLEAILHGKQVTRLPRRRGARHTRVR